MWGPKSKAERLGRLDLGVKCEGTLWLSTRCTYRSAVSTRPAQPYTSFSETDLSKQGLNVYRYICVRRCLNMEKRIKAHTCYARQEIERADQ